MSNRGDSIGAGMPEGTRTVSQIANEVGVSAETIRRWCDDGYMPYETVQRGQLTVRVFTDEHVERARLLAAESGHLARRAS